MGEPKWQRRQRLGALGLVVLSACGGPEPAPERDSRPSASASGSTSAGPASALESASPAAADAGAAGDAGQQASVASSPQAPLSERPVAADEALFGTAEALGPSLAATTRDWFVGWTEGAGPARLTYVSTERRARSKLPPTRLSPAQGSNVSVAATGTVALAAWLEPGPPAAVWTSTIDESGASSGRRRISSGSEPAGPPAVIAHGKEFVVAWPQGLDVEAARLSEQGAIVATTSWRTGVLRPPGPINTQPGGEESRLGPEPEAPSLSIRGGQAVVSWRGGVWLSDDVHRLGTYSYAPRWASPEQPPLSPLVMPFGGAGELLAVAGDRAQLAVQAVERSTPGAPWGLALARLDQHASTPALPITSEPMGPLQATLLETNRGFVAAWPSPSRGGVAVCTVGPDAKPGEVRVIPSLASTVEGTVALASGGSPPRPRVAYVDRVAGASVVRLAWLDDSIASRVAKPAAAKAVSALAGQALEDVTAAPLADGRRWLMAWKGGSYQPIFAVWLTDGQPTGAVEDLLDHDKGPRSGEIGSAAPAGDAVLLAYQRCDDPYHCVGPRAEVAVLRPPRARVAVTLAASVDYRYPRIATRSAQDALHVGVAMTKGSDAGPVVARLVAVPNADDAPKALARATDVDLTEEGWAISTAWVDDTFVTAILQESADPTVLRLVGVRDGTVTKGVRLEAGDTWGAHRMVAVPGGLALFGTRRQGNSTDLVLYWISRDLRQVTRTTVIARGAGTVYGLSAALADRRIGLAWYDHRSESIFAARVDLTGSFVAGPRRLDGPPSQVGDDTVIIPVPNGLRAWWPADDGVHTELLPRP